MPNTETAGPAVDRAFINLIETHKRGDVITEISAATKQAIAATQLTGKASAVSLVITFSPASRGTVGTLVVHTKVKSKLPEEEQHGSIFYADGDFNLVREDPNQARLPLKEIEETETKTKLKQV